MVVVSSPQELPTAKQLVALGHEIDSDCGMSPLVPPAHVPPPFEVARATGPPLVAPPVLEAATATQTEADPQDTACIAAAVFEAWADHAPPVVFKITPEDPTPQQVVPTQTS